jgi:phage baseplate assembly protein W
MRKFKGFSTVERNYGNFKLYDVDLAKRDLLNELYTRKGERLMSPHFGSIVWDLLFDPLLEEVVDKIRDDCQRIVSKDPRWKLLNLDVTESQDLQQLSVVLILRYVPSAQTIELLASYNRSIATEQLEG